MRSSEDVKSQDDLVCVFQVKASRIYDEAFDLVLQVFFQILLAAADVFDIDAAVGIDCEMYLRRMHARSLRKEVGCSYLILDSVVELLLGGECFLAVIAGKRGGGDGQKAEGDDYVSHDD